MVGPISFKQLGVRCIFLHNWKYNISNQVLKYIAITSLTTYNTILITNAGMHNINVSNFDYI